MEPRCTKTFGSPMYDRGTTVHFGSIMTMEISTRKEDLAVAMAVFDSQIYIPMVKMGERLAASSFESVSHDKSLKTTQNALSIFNALGRGYVWHS